MRIKLNNNNTLGFVTMSAFPRSVQYKTAKKKYPDIKDPSELWHMAFFDADYLTFIKSTHDYWQTLNTAEQVRYISTIKSWLLKNNHPQHIKNVIMLDIVKPYAGWMYTTMFPEWGDWWNRWHLTTGLKRWMKSTIKHNKTVLDNPKSKAEHAHQIKALIADYAEDDYLSTVPTDLANEFYATIFKDEIGEIQAAQITQQLASKKQMIVVGASVGALIGGVFLIKALMRK